VKNFTDSFVHQDTSIMSEKETTPASSRKAPNAQPQLQSTSTSGRDANNDDCRSPNGTLQHDTPPSAVIKVVHTDDEGVKGLHDALRASSSRDGSNQ
jgi:hypothetical protein